MSVGARVVVRFDRMGPRGEALASLEGRVVAVPYGAPGEEATVRIVDSRGSLLRGQIVVLRRVSPRVVPPPCPHFGRCGGCQWQHLPYTLQLEQKTLLVREALSQAGLGHLAVEPAVGWEPPYEFRTRLLVAVGLRDGRPVLGFYAWGGSRLVDVRTCPVQHPGTAAVLAAVRAAWESLAPLLVPGPGGRPLLRGILARVGAATGDVLLGLATGAPLGGDLRMTAVRSLLDSVPGLVSLVEVRVPPRGHLLRGRRASLLWGRPYVREEVAGVRYHVPALAEFPTNARALPGLIELILQALDAGPEDTVLEPDAGIGTYSLHLALASGRAVGVTDVATVEAAWDNARLNRITNCMFYTRDPARALAKVARHGPVRLAFLHPPAPGVPAGLVEALRDAGVRRIVYLGGLRALGRDARALGEGGYAIARVQPVDLSPQTSRVAALLVAEKV
jgi:23S rRNA (uracil1939-C5)-methyltransferase